MTLTFDEAKHEYRFNGRLLLSTTQILQLAGIIDPTKYAPGAAQNGSEGHAACEMYDLMGEWPSDGKMRGYVTAWAAFQQHKGLKPGCWIAIEQPQCSEKFGFAGTPDRLGERLIVDIKCGVKERWHRIQSAAYALMQDSPYAYERWCVYLRPDGTYAIEEHPRTETVRDIQVFMSALTLVNWKQGEKKCQLPLLS